MRLRAPRAVNPSSAFRRGILAVAFLLLLGLTWTGIHGGLDQLPQAQSTGERAQTFAQFAYGALGLLCVLTTFWGRRWRPVVQACWALSVALAAGLASVVWGGTSPALACSQVAQHC
jgi:hypothetical protein